MTNEGNANGERIDEPLVNSAVVGVPYASPEAADAMGGLTVDEFTATATIAGGDPDERRTLNWGDGSPEEEYVLSDSGGQVASHTYAAAGTYTVTAADSAGNMLTSDTVEIVDPAPPSGDDGPAPEEDKGTYEPGEHTVADVEAYVAEHPDERAAITVAERAGKNRSTLLEALGG